MAWGTIGHKTIAYIAQDELTLRSREKISQLLALDNAKDLADISMWADKYKNEHPELPDHMVRMPLEDTGYDAQRDCPPTKQLCVVKGLEEQIANLKNNRLSAAERLLALKLVVHFVGDVHSPMHAIYHSGAEVVWKNQNMTMHSLWEIPGVTQLGVNPRELSRSLEINLKNIVQGASEDWANEGHQIALKYFKPLLDKTQKGQPIILSDDYLQSIAPVVKLRLQQAGIRLGRVLNSIFDQ